MYRTLNLDNKYILLVQSTRVTKASIMNILLLKR